MQLSSQGQHSALLFPCSPQAAPSGHRSERLLHLLKQAARLISEGKINIAQAAFAVGFNNQTYFSTAFKKHFGMTPTEYAEKGLNP